MKAVILSVLPLAFLAACGASTPGTVAPDTAASVATDDPSCTIETRDGGCHQETHFELRPFSAEALEQARRTPVGGEVEDSIIICRRNENSGYWVIANPELVDGVLQGMRIPHSAEPREVKFSLPVSEISALVMPVNRYVAGAGDPQFGVGVSCP